jgi:hypothetical protein
MAEQLSSGIDTFRHPYQWWEREVLVRLECNSCDTSYELEVNDLLDIAVDGEVLCECGEYIRIPLHIRLGWCV